MKRTIHVPLLMLLVLPFLVLDVLKTRARRCATAAGWGHP